ncbi:hypothetical protein [Kitasatospora sp. SolWspMP-SS2h]|uniref:hypothetical protein n=1 Tax=Kitasatospora sp. SolWspMP-SS2h TaxID=1305729 RepID=UPI0011B94B94|nr:hypothetical protein [Kitasatospora sp. SolWspMP-SS2h]
MTGLRSYAAAAVGAAAMLGALTAAPAHAAPLDATCTGTDTTTYTPGLTNTPRTVTISGRISLSCLSPSRPAITGATITGGGTAPDLTCAVLEQPSSGTSTIAWSDGSRSTYTYTTALGPGAAGTQVLTLTGTITSGTFAPDSLLIAVVFANTDLNACNSTSGLTGRSGPATLTVS